MRATRWLSAGFVMGLPLLLSASAIAQDTRRTAGPPAAPPLHWSHSILWEEDNLQGTAHTDRNYTMGLGFQGTTTFPTNREVPDWSWRKVDGLVGWTLGKVLGQGFEKTWNPRDFRRGAEKIYFTRMLSGTAFTPEDLTERRPIVGDRPYAFLLGWTTKVVFVPREESAQVAITREVTVGTIGSPIGRFVQRTIHYAGRAGNGTDSPHDPVGWPNQILNSPTGIPTVRYRYDYARLLAGCPCESSYQGTRSIELVANGGIEGGYYTDAYAGGRIRIGSFSHGFWQFEGNPLGGGSRGPGLTGRLEWFAYGSFAQRAYAYNALLQGYGNLLSKHRLGREDIRSFAAEWNVGVSVARIAADGRTKWELVYEEEAGRSPEFYGPNARRHSWGGIFLTCGF